MSAGRLIRLSTADKVALLRVATTLMAVRAGLRVLPADRLARLVGVPLLLSDAHPAPLATPDTVPAARRRDLRMLGTIVRRWPPRSGSRCLEESLTIGIIFRSYRPRLRIGVASRAGGLAAHAWVEAGDRSFLADPSYVPLGPPRVVAVS